MLVSICIPAFNAEQWIAEALDSALGQAHRPIELVVVDDGSSDGTASVAERHGGPIRVLRRGHAGTAAARNACLELARGELIAFLDADDRWTGESLHSRIGVLATRPDIALVFGHVRSFTRTAAGEPVPSGAAQAARTPGTMLARRSAFDTVGLFSEEPGLATELDWLLRARDLGVGEDTVGEVVCWRRVHGANSTLVLGPSGVGYTRAIKASLDRRRTRGPTPGAQR